jgi:hypothetical protein
VHLPHSVVSSINGTHTKRKKIWVDSFSSSDRFLLSDLLLCSYTYSFFIFLLCLVKVMSFVDAYAGALKSFDGNAWRLFSASQARIVNSAEQLLLGLENKALRPAVCGAHLDPSVFRDAAASTTPLLLSANIHSTVLSPRLGLLNQADAAALQTRPSEDGCSSCTARERLEKELTVLALQLDGVAVNAASCPTTCVFGRLSSLNRAVLAFTALWVCTKFWGTVSESSTLSGLVACFCRYQPPPQQQQQWVSGAHDTPLTGNVNQEAGSSAAVGAPALTTAVVVSSAFTPPRSPVGAPSLLPHDTPDQSSTNATRTAVTAAACVGAAHGASPEVFLRNDVTLLQTPTRENRKGDACSHERQNLQQHNEGGNDSGVLDALDCPLLPHTAMWYDGVSDAVDAITHDVEDCEVMLLRCCDYSVPL